MIMRACIFSPRLNIECSPSFSVSVLIDVMVLCKDGHKRIVYVYSRKCIVMFFQFLFGKNNINTKLLADKGELE